MDKSQKEKQADSMTTSDIILSEILPDILLKQAQKILKRYAKEPGFAAKYLEELIENSEQLDSDSPEVIEVKNIIKELREKHKDHSDKEILFNLGTQAELREEISEYYLRHQLVEAIMETGSIPSDPVETWVGIGFIDIANYSYLSKWLSPKENQVVLNGLYSALNIVLNDHGGFLNKMEGDSLMFHYGGTIDPQVKGKSNEEILVYITRELFYTCIDMQKICALFNSADDRFLTMSKEEETKQALNEAFHIIKNLRENMMFASVINALFQIQIRIGANIGEVSIGNFGPMGAKQWDIIGVPVIEAKRMEATAPIGGLRISEQFYEQLEKTGITEEYHKSFKKEAASGFFKDITKKQLFKFSRVKLSEKGNATFNTYSVQVNPNLPDEIKQRINILLQMQEDGANQIIQTLQYFRGNRHVMEAIEALFNEHHISLKKDLLLKAISSKIYEENRTKFGTDFREQIYKKYTLFQLMALLGRYQDKLKSIEQPLDTNVDFKTIEQFIAEKEKKIEEHYQHKRQFMTQRNYFYNKIFPMVFDIIKASILDYQHSHDEAEHLEEIT